MVPRETFFFNRQKGIHNGRGKDNNHQKEAGQEIPKRHISPNKFLQHLDEDVSLGAKRKFNLKMGVGWEGALHEK